jgi:hypothetical protein
MAVMWTIGFVDQLVDERAGEAVDGLRFVSRESPSFLKTPSVFRVRMRPVLSGEFGLPGAWGRFALPLSVRRSVLASVTPSPRCRTGAVTMHLPAGFAPLQTNGEQ